MSAGGRWALVIGALSVLVAAAVGGDLRRPVQHCG